jgi:hypothetical protein
MKPNTDTRILDARHPPAAATAATAATAAATVFKVSLGLRP